MRVLCVWLVSAVLWAGSAPELALPGRNEAFVLQVVGNTDGGRLPWHAFQLPPITASAVVEVIGYLSPAERRQEAIEEFLAWFHEDLRKFLRAHGASLEEAAARPTSVQRYGGNPVLTSLPMGRVDF